MLFLIQNTQNRDTEAIQVNLDELEEETLEAFRVKYQALASAARAELSRGALDAGTPEP
jgi:low affinity Fe/Cu permease